LETRPTEIETREVIKTRKVRLLPKPEINRLLSMGMKLSNSLKGLTRALDDAYATKQSDHLTPEREAKRTKPTPATPISRAKAKEPPDSTGIGKAHKAILTVLHTYGSRSKIQLAFLAGYVHSGGAFNNPLSNLRTRGWVEGKSDIALTPEGRSYAAHYAENHHLPAGKALLEHWLGLSHFGKAHRAILTAVADIWPGNITKDLLAEMTAYSPIGGAFNNPLSRLRSLKLIKGSGTLSDPICLTEEFGKAIDR
ncbi:MAG: hypothetical protein J3T61_10075, partial [Candidatus Brocadiales bacterium]|nr:hypothetical protein [Candidatus Bathyanammoxibius sp.]